MSVPAGEYNLRLGINKEIEPDFVSGTFRFLFSNFQILNT